MRRHDDLIKDQKNIVKQIDDALMVINMKKFVFAQTEVNYSSFRITSNMVKPLEKNLEAIRTFPMLTNISRVRSLYALANNTSFCTKVKNLLSEFRPLLSPKTKFYWNDAMTKEFREVTNSLVE